MSKRKLHIALGIILYFQIFLYSFFGFIPVISVKAASYTNISVHTAYGMINNNTEYPDLIILDVRSPSEYDSVHIQNAILIPNDEIDTRISELAPYNDTEIIVYCFSGSRSASASQNLAENHNFTKIFNMEGGIDAWIDADYPVIQPNNTPLYINFSFIPFIIFLSGMIFILALYFKKCIYIKEKKRI